MGLESCYVSFQNGGFKSFENSTIKLSTIETKYIGKSARKCRSNLQILISSMSSGPLSYQDFWETGSRNLGCIQ